MRAAIYVRVSTEEQASSASAQEDGARLWCAREGHVVSIVYRDEGVSGGEWARRAGVLQLRADASTAPRPWDLLIVRDLDRLGRDAIRLPELLSHLADQDVRVIEWSTGQTVALDGMALIVAQLRAGLAQIEREQIAHRTRTALAQKATRGLVTGGVVYGYRNVRSADGVRYEIHPDEAEVVRELYRRAAEGASARTLAALLNRRGVLSPRAEGGGTGSWCSGTVRAILRSARYRGEATWGEIGSRYKGGTRILVQRDDVIRYAVPAIVTDAQWRAAQVHSDAELAARQRPPHRGPAPKYLLIGHAVCSACGGPIASARTSSGVGRTRRILTAYTCGRARDRGTCEARWYRPTDRLDAVVLEWLASDVLGADRLSAAIERARERHRQESAGAPDPRIADLAAEESECGRVVSRLTTALEMGAGDLSDVVDRLRARTLRRAALRAELAVLTTPAPVVSLDVERKLLSIAGSLREVLATGYQERPDLVRGVLGSVLADRLRVEATPDGLRMEGEAYPGRLLWSEAARTRGMVVTPTGPDHTPGLLDALRIPLRRAV